MRELNELLDDEDDDDKKKKLDFERSISQVYVYKIYISICRRFCCVLLYTLFPGMFPRVS